MNIYYCEVCGIRLSNDDLPLGAPPLDDTANVHYCEKHRPPDLVRVPVKPKAGKSNQFLKSVPPALSGIPTAKPRAGGSNAVLKAVSPAGGIATKPMTPESGVPLNRPTPNPGSRATPGGGTPQLRRTTPKSNSELHAVPALVQPHAAPAQTKRKRGSDSGTSTTIWASAGVVLIFGALFIFMSSGSKTNRNSKARLPEPALSSQPAPAQTQSPAQPQAHETARPPALLIDTSESTAQRMFNDVKALEKAGKPDSPEVRKLLEEIVAKYRETRAGADAAEKLQKLNGPPFAGIWWEGEKPFETNFVSNIWLEKQLDSPEKLSGKCWLNHLYNKENCKPELGTPIFAKYRINVPNDGTFTLWARVFFLGSGSKFRMRFDEQEWIDFERPHTTDNNMPLGKWRDVMWTSWGSVTLNKGSHIFTVEVPQPGLSGFDCFYLALQTFHPNGPTVPAGAEVQK